VNKSRRWGYGKRPHAFAEFLWANFFRIRIIIDEAMHLARSPEAAGMPVYLGPS